MKKEILIITSDNLGLKKEQFDYPSLEIIKCPVYINGKEYRESDHEYTANWLIEKYLKENIVAKSSSILQGDLIDIIEKNKDKYSLVIHVLMSHGVSAATTLVAENVKKIYRDVIPILNIDTRQTSLGIGLVLLKIIEIIKQHDHIDDILRLADEAIRNTYSVFVMHDLNYLFKSGRIGKARALMGSVLRIIPLVGISGEDKEGLVVPIGKARTFMQANDKIIEFIHNKMLEKSVVKVQYIVNSLGYGDNLDAVSDLSNKIKESVPYEKMITGQPHLVEAVYYGPKSYSISINI